MEFLQSLWTVIIVFAKKTILDVWLGSESASVTYVNMNWLSAEAYNDKMQIWFLINYIIEC